MPRKIVPMVAGEYYHVYNRGVDKRKIFLDEHDFIRFYTSLRYFNNIEPVGSLRSIKKTANIVSQNKLVDVVAYALLPNHFHILVRAITDEGVGEYLKRIQGGFTSYFNEKNDRSGSLFQGTYKRIIVDTDEYLNYLMAYINENQLVHGVTTERKIFHSSSLHYQGIARSKVISDKTETHNSYNLEAATLLARHIYDKRAQFKALIMED